MRVHDCARYLLGSRAAILTIAGSRGALAVGALLVLASSVARNYDGKDLLREWDVLLHGIGVSLGNAVVLWTLLYGVAATKKAEKPPYFSGFLSFLALFWMTAPMAWLYAVPYEQFLPPADAIRANAWTLALVSAWRVLLVARALSVIWGARFWTVLCIVLLFADVVVFLGAAYAPAPMVDFMGGFQYTPEETALADLNFAAHFWSLFLLPAACTAALVGWAKFKGAWSVGSPDRRVHPTVWALPAAAFLALAPGVAIMQPEQRLRYRVEELLCTERVDEGLREMSRHERRMFPRVWDPPPRVAFHDSSPPMEQVRAALAEGGQSPWVRAIYLEKSLRCVVREHYYSVRSSTVAGIVGYEHADPTPELVEQLRFHFAHDERLTDDERAALGSYMERLQGTLERTEPPE